MPETNHWPFVQARDYTPVAAGHPRSVRLIVIHDMEAVERDSTAEDVARYFQHPDNPSSAHICVDNNSIIQCVYDRDIAWAAPGANHDGIQIELAGYGSQSRTQWLDAYGIAMLALASDAVAQYALKFNIPIVHLTNGELNAGMKGVVGHYQVSQVYHKSDHTDPGPGFPWDYFLASARQFYTERTRRTA